MKWTKILRCAQNDNWPQKPIDFQFISIDGEKNFEIMEKNFVME